MFCIKLLIGEDVCDKNSKNGRFKNATREVEVVFLHLVCDAKGVPLAASWGRCVFCVAKQGHIATLHP
jgi:hypothetical protein